MSALVQPNKAYMDLEKEQNIFNSPVNKISASSIHCSSDYIVEERSEYKDIIWKNEDNFENNFNDL